ncbi:uncharacterized protein [Drosophila virilis]|uniref:Uncharacterized protein n=1 Tax=Drosophila virilis TaxID=7244 RepID=B4LVF7_DROVI|nr:uncharacterized protein LOC6628296 [Drosophila virilis]EDW63336.1 uncharacterized protein Dvir_GJ13676 [Drosophila virilis]
MSLQLLHVISLLGCLLIGLAFCQSASVERVRITRDTRNIPSDQFKPLGESSNTDQNATTAPQRTNFDDTFSVHTKAKARVLTDPTSQEEDYADETWPTTPRFPDPRRFNYPTRIPIPSSQFRSTNLDTSFNSNVGPFVGGRRISGPPGFGASGFGDGDYSGSRFSSLPLSIQSNSPFIPTNTGFSTFSGPGFGGGSSNNFYRSESYSFNSDGMEPPQIQQSVFDSRLGHGMTTRNF